MKNTNFREQNLISQGKLLDGVLTTYPHAKPQMHGNVTHAPSTHLIHPLVQRQLSYSYQLKKLNNRVMSLYLQ